VESVKQSGNGDCGHWLSRAKACPYRAAIGRRIYELISTSENSLMSLVKLHPELPSLWTIHFWRKKYPAFAKLYEEARQNQAEYLIQRSLDYASEVTPKTAHATRVRFDIHRFFSGHILPQLYGDRPTDKQPAINATNVLVVSSAKLSQIRNALEHSRRMYTKPRQSLQNPRKQALISNKPSDTSEKPRALQP
jgi:hypothetical protein